LADDRVDLPSTLGGATGCSGSATTAIMVTAGQGLPGIIAIAVRLGSA